MSGKTRHFPCQEQVQRGGLVSQPDSSCLLGRLRLIYTVGLQPTLGSWPRYIADIYSFSASIWLSWAMQTRSTGAETKPSWFRTCPQSVRFWTGFNRTGFAKSLLRPHYSRRSIDSKIEPAKTGASTPEPNQNRTHFWSGKKDAGARHCGNERLKTAMLAATLQCTFRSRFEIDSEKRRILRS